MMFQQRLAANLERCKALALCGLPRSPLRQVATEEKLVSGFEEEFWTAQRHASPDTHPSSHQLFQLASHMEITAGLWGHRAE